MTTPTNVEFVDQTTVVSEVWLDGVNDWVYGWFGVMGETFTAAAARTAFSAAALGANSDITSITGLTTALDETMGGTGIATYTAGDTLYASGANTLAKLAKGTAAQVLTMNAGATAPEWATPATATTGTLTAGTLCEVTLGGTGITTAAHGLGVRPKYIECYLECVNAAGSAGYALGKQIEAPPLNVNGSYVVEADATNTNIRINTGNTTIPHGTTYAPTVITLADWKLVAVPYKLN